MGFRLVAWVRRENARRVAAKKLAFRSQQEIVERVSFTGSLVEAYRIGAKDAQVEIVARLRRMKGMMAREDAH